MTIVDVIRDAVEKVQARWDNEGQPFFFHGHLQEVVNTFIEYDNSSRWSEKKFPCIILVHDFTESITGDFVDVKLNLIITTHSKQEYKASDRYEHTFTPVLYPLMELLFDELKFSNYIDKMEVTYDKTDRLFWGTNNENTGTDYLDAIDLENINLRILKSC